MSNYGLLRSYAYPSCSSSMNWIFVLLSFSQNLSVCPEDESIIMSSFVNTMTSLSVKQGEGFVSSNKTQQHYTSNLAPYKSTDVASRFLF